MTAYYEVTPFVGYGYSPKTHTHRGLVQLGHGKVLASCGRWIKPETTYAVEDWPKMVETHVRLSKTHVTYACAGCVKVYLRQKEAHILRVMEQGSSREEATAAVESLKPFTGASWEGRDER